MKVKEKILMIFLLFLGFVPFLWYRQGAIIHGVDISLPISIQTFFSKGISCWDFSINAGKDSVLSLPKLPEFNVLKFIGFLGFSPEKIEIIFFVLIFQLTFFSFYFFLCQFEKNGNIFVPFFGSLFYIFNFFSLTRYEAIDRPIFYISIGVPLILGLMIKNSQKEKLINYFFLGLSSILFSIAAINIPTLLMGGFVISVFMIFFIGEPLAARKFLEFRKRLLLGIKYFTVFLVFNLFWFVPFLMKGTPGAVFQQTAPAHWLDPISKNTSFSNVIRLMGAWYWYEGWEGKPYAPYAQIYFQNKIFVFLTWMVPFVCSLGFLLIKKKKDRLFFGFLALIGIILSMGVHPPLGGLYRFLYNNNLFFFRIFRSPWFKFSFLTIFSYAYFYGIFVSSFLNKGKSLKKNRRSFYLFIFFLFSLFPLVLNYPLVTGKIFENFRVKIPEFVIKTSGFLKDRVKEGERVLLLPFSENERYPWGYQGGTPILYFLTDKPILGSWIEGLPNDPATPLLKLIKRKIYLTSNDPISDYLSALGIRYLIHRKDTVFSENDSPEFIKKSLNARKEVDFLESFGSWDIYENKDKIFPLFFLGKHLVSVDSIDSFSYGFGLGKGKLLFTEETSLLGLLGMYKLSPRDFSRRNDEDHYFFGFRLEEENEYRFFLKISQNTYLPQLFLDKNLLVLSPVDEDGLFVADRRLTAGSHLVEIKSELFPKFNLIKNGDFSLQTSFWELLGVDVAYGKILSSLQVLNPGEVQLKAENQSTAMVQKITSLKENTPYRLTFSFKNLNGLPILVGVWQEGSSPGFIVNPAENQYFADKKTKKEIIFSTGNSTTVYLYFYANVNSINTRNNQAISEVFLDEIKGIKEIVILPKIEEELVGLDDSKAGSRSYRLNFSTNSAVWLVFNSSFNSGWAAFEKGEKLKHLKINSFANGFYIPSAGNHMIEIVFLPQRYFEYSKLSTAFVIILFLIMIFLKREA